MRERPVSFAPRGAETIVLEGRLLEGGGAPFVMSHPHPLHGGNMDHPVVTAVWRAAAEAGLTSLRYNFRGVGLSQGRLEKRSPLATADLLGAIDFLGGGPVRAAGYSYGARTTLRVLSREDAVVRAALVALPTRLPENAAAMSNLILGRRLRGEQYRESADLAVLAATDKPVLVVAGDKDPLVEPERLRERGIAPVLLEGLNHFFSRKLGNQPPEEADLARLAGIVVDFVNS